MTNPQPRPDRFAILADPAGIGPQVPLAERAAAARRALLDQLGELTAILAAPDGPTAEGVDVDELARIRSAALRLAAAADAALTGQAPQ